jgi:hypothetical protein
VPVEPSAGRGREHQLPIRAGRPGCEQPASQAGRERDVALAIARLGLADLAVGELPTQLDVWPAIEDEVAFPAQLDRFPDAQAGVGE